MLPLHQTYMVGRDGVEPPEVLPVDLQSTPLPLTVYLPLIGGATVNRTQTTFPLGRLAIC